MTTCLAVVRLTFAASGSKPQTMVLGAPSTFTPPRLLQTTSTDTTRTYSTLYKESVTSMVIPRACLPACLPACRPDFHHVRGTSRLAHTGAPPAHHPHPTAPAPANVGLKLELVNSWRAPGHAPTANPCGYAGGTPWGMDGPEAGDYVNTSYAHHGEELHG